MDRLKFDDSGKSEYRDKFDRDTKKKKEKFEIAEEKYSTVKKFPSKIVGQ